MQADNDFRIYRPAGSDPLLPRRQADAHQSNLQLEGAAAYQSRRRQYQVEVSALLNDARRQLPPPTTKYSSAQRLLGQTLALVINQRFAHKASGLDYMLTTGALLDDSRYIDEAGIPSTFNARQWQAMGSLSKTLSPRLGITKFRFQHGHALGLAPSYVQQKALQTHNAEAGFSINHGPLRIEPSANFFMAQGVSHATWGIDASFVHQKNWAESCLRFTTKPLFRAPTLNDLYYPGLGNPSLRPEQGRLYELALGLTSKPGKAGTFSAEVIPFVYDYQRFILWQPSGNLWTPVLLSHARSSGLTFKGSLGARYRAWQITWANQATLSQGGLGGALFQLEARPTPFLYTPATRLTSSLVARRNHNLVSFQASYTGARPTVADQSVAAMQAFLIYTLALAKSDFDLLGGKASWALQVHVASRPDYAWVPNYAAPRWWGQLSLSYGLSTRT